MTSGGTESGAIISGGVLEVAANGVLTSDLTFSGSGGKLLIDGTTMPTATISGFAVGDSIPLAAIACNASDTVSVKTAGVVTISAGGNAYNLDIAGATVGATNFSLSSATSGSGTVLKDPPANASLFADIRDPQSFVAATPPASTSSGFSSPTTSADTAGMTLVAPDFYVACAQAIISYNG